MRFILIPFLLIIGILSVNGQVILDSYLTEDHKGKLSKSEWFGGEPMNYKFEFESSESGKEYQSTESIQKIHYKLHLGKGDQRIVFDVLIRDLIVTTYFEIDTDSGPDASVISAIYNKRNRWVKLKGVIDEECKREGQIWSRLDQVENFDQLLKFIIKDIDQNVDLSCFKE